MSSSDMAYALIRDYLQSHGMRHTLQSLDMDHYHANRFTRTELVFLLSLQELQAINKNRKDPFLSLLQIISYDLSLKTHKHPVGTNPYLEKARITAKLPRPASHHPKKSRSKPNTAQNFYQPAKKKLVDVKPLFKEPYRWVKDSEKVYRKLKEVKPYGPVKKNNYVEEEKSESVSMEMVENSFGLTGQPVESKPYEPELQKKATQIEKLQHLLGSGYNCESVPLSNVEFQQSAFKAFQGKKDKSIASSDKESYNEIWEDQVQWQDYADPYELTEEKSYEENLIKQGRRKQVQKMQEQQELRRKKEARQKEQELKQKERIKEKLRQRERKMDEMRNKQRIEQQKRQKEKLEQEMRQKQRRQQELRQKERLELKLRQKREQQLQQQQKREQQLQQQQKREQQLRQQQKREQQLRQQQKREQQLRQQQKREQQQRQQQKREQQLRQLRQQQKRQQQLRQQQKREQQQAKQKEKLKKQQLKRQEEQHRKQEQRKKAQQIQDEIQEEYQDDFHFIDTPSVITNKPPQKQSFPLVQQPISLDPPKKIKMFGKKKNQESQQKEAPSKADKLFADMQEYVPQHNQKLQKAKITAISQLTCPPGLTDKFKHTYDPKIVSKKKTWKAIPDLQAYKTLLYKDGIGLPKSWSQGWIFSEHPETPFGLIQIQGGPCGLIAAVQCYFLKHLLFDRQNDGMSTPTSQKERCLIGALTELLLKVCQNDQVKIVKRKSPSSQTVRIDFCQFIRVHASFKEVFGALNQIKREYLTPDGSGVALTLYSVVLSKGLHGFEKDMDRQQQLIGAHGHCSQQLVNLFITGLAYSNTFDGSRQIDGDCTLHGISQKGLFGFLTIFEHLNLVQVGRNLKQPIFPMWIISKEYHYSVLFGLDYRISDREVEEVDLIFYDGLYSADRRIVLTVQRQKPAVEMKVTPMIEKVISTKWGKCKVDWNGSQPIL